MNENQQFADAVLIRVIELQSVATWLLNDWFHRLEVLERDIVAEIARHDPTDEAGAGRLEALVEAVREKIKAVFEELINRAGDAFDELADIQAEQERENFLAIFGIALAVSFVALSAGEIEVMGLKIAEWLRRTGGDLELRTVGAIRRGVTAGDSLTKLINRVRGKSDLAGEVETPLVQPSKTSLETMTRTAVESLAEKTRERAAENILPIVEVTPGAVATTKEIRYGWQQISVLDSRTTTICRSYAFKIWDKNFKPIGHSLPYNGGVPRHANCRSSIVLILLDSDPIALQEFVDFVERQSEEVKKSVFGSKAYALWQAGKINDSDLIRSRERQLTFDDLRKRNRKKK